MFYYSRLTDDTPMINKGGNSSCSKVVCASLYSYT